MEAHMVTTKETAPQTWVPDFCAAPTLAAVALGTQLVACAIAWAPPVSRGWNLGGLALGTLFAQWLALCCALCLCRLKPLLDRLSVARSATVAFATTALVAWLGAAVAYGIDQMLGLGATAPTPGMTTFANHVALIAAIVSAAALRYFYVRAQWQSGVRAQARAQFEALQARIRPHFLFNSMNTVASLVRTRPADAERAIEDLCDLFRSAVLPGPATSTLGQELDLAMRYLAIEQLRLGDRLRIRADLEQLPKSLPIPALILQPLVENAVYHGIAALPAGGVIEIYPIQLHPDLVIGIRNPVPPESAHGQTGLHSAVENIRQRLRYFYGDRAQLHAHAAGDAYEVHLNLPQP